MDEIKFANESFLGKLQYLSGTNTGEDGQAEENTEDYFVLNDQYVEEEEVKELEGHTSGSNLPVAHTAVNNITGLKISWGNYRGVKIILKIYQVQIQRNMFKLSKRSRISLFFIINMLRRKR